MDDDLLDETIDCVADRYGIAIDDDRPAHRETIRNLAATAEAFEVDPPVSDEPADVRTGDDTYNAFRKGFDLPPTAADGPLAGLAIAVKENTVVAGVETTCGSPGFSYTPPYSATVVERLRGAGATIDRVSIDGYVLVGAAAGTLIRAEFAAFVAGDGVQYGLSTGTTKPLCEAIADATEDCEFGENVREQLLYNGTLNEHLAERHYVAAADFRRRFTATIREQFLDVDALVTPTTPTTAPAFGEVRGMDGLLRTMANTAPFNLTGSPAVSVPCGRTGVSDGTDDRSGSPIGFQVVADWHDEATALRVARTVESAG